MMPKKTKSERDSDLLDEMSKNIGSWYSAYDKNLQDYRFDRDFLFLEQWDSNDRSEFDRLQKPRLTFNKIYDFFKKVVGEQRQNTPDLKVRCLNGESSQEAVTLRADLVRQIAYDSKSDIAYQTAFESALSGGFGAIRVSTHYRSPTSFEQEISIDRIENAERVFFDPNAKQPTKFDGDFCGYYDRMSKSDFDDKFPDVQYPQSFPEQFEIQNFNWGDDDTISVVEYYRKEWTSFKLHKLSDGQTVTDKEYTKIKQEYEELAMLEDVEGIEQAIVLPEVVSTRQSGDYKIMCYKAIYGEIIERYEWAGKHFPIIFCPGDIHIVEGEERTISFVRFVKDAQRFLNYCGSEIAQSIKNNRREQFLATPANVSGNGLDRMWKNPANQQGVLIANPDPITNQMPIKLPASEVPQSLLQQYQRAEGDLQSILGYYEANRGAQGQELSGVALQERQRTGNMGVAVFFSNLDRMIEQVGRVIMSLIPKIYDTERRISMQSQDGSDRDITVNQEFAGGQKENDLTEGEYDVVISAGPSFAVQRQEAVALLIDMVKINPQIFPLVADLVAENIDIENNPQLVERFKTLVPPEILAKESGQPPPPPKPDPMAEIAQQEMQLREKQLQIDQKELEIKEAELQMKQQSQMLESEKEFRQQQIDEARAMVEAEKLQLDRDLAQIRGAAEVEKANIDYQGDLAMAYSRIIAAQAAVSKSNHATACELTKVPSLDERFRTPGRVSV